MSLNFSNLTRKDRVSKLSAIFHSQPELLYKNAYINFLREFRIRHLDLEISELYHEAANAWMKLSDKDRKAFRYLDVIRDIKHRRAMKKQRTELAKKLKSRKRKVFSSRRVMRRNKRRIYPIQTFKRRRRHQRQRKRTKIDKETRSLKKPSRDTARARRILNRLRMINKTRKTGRRRRQRRSQPRRRVQRRRQVKRRK